MKGYDAVIFDMDGTLWDAVDSYCKIWDVTIEQCGLTRSAVQRDELVSMMGLSLDVIADKVIPLAEPMRSTFLQRLDENERLMMPVLGGRLYPGVVDMLQRLKPHYHLSMVSNCGSDGLHNFVRFCGLQHLIEDTLAFGETGMPKDRNIRLMCERHNLKNPLYVGDTQSDARAATLAGVDMCHAAYGFGHVDNPTFVIHSPSQLADILVEASDDNQG